MTKRPRLTIAAVLLLAAGAVEVVHGLYRTGSLGSALPHLASLISPLGSLLAELWPTTIPAPGGAHLFLGILTWLAGCLVLAASFPAPAPTSATPTSEAAAGVHPRLSRGADFHWETLIAYGLGIFAAELVTTVVVTLLTQGESSSGSAYPIALTLGVALAFAGGFIGAARAHRLAIPEATIAVLYFGLPVPALLSLVPNSPVLMLKLGYRLREVLYLSSLFNESSPALGIGLTAAALILALFLGMTVGFVSTSSGRFDVRLSYEMFIASRHTAVFKPSLAVGVFAVLVLGIIPPLLILGIVRAAHVVAARARIRTLGLTDPLRAAEELDRISHQRQTPTATMTALSVGGVGVGVMALIIVLSVMSGFEADLQQKILGTHADGIVLESGTEMQDYEQLLPKVREVKGVVAATPFILNEGMVSAGAYLSGAMIKGIDPATAGSVTNLKQYLLPPTELSWLSNPALIPAHSEDGLLPSDEQEPSEARKPSKARLPSEAPLPSVLLGRELALQLRVTIGDRVNLISPLGGGLGPQGPMPKSRAFQVAGIFYSGMYEYDAKIAYLQLRDAADFFGVKGASGLEVKVRNIDTARSTMRRISEQLGGYPYHTKDWGEMNRNLFSALRLEKLVMGIILSIIIVVAAGLIVATVMMLVLEKRKDIAVLKALGVPDGGIVKIFLAEGLQIGILGGVLGLISGLLWCLFIERVGIHLDPQVYYIPRLPVLIESSQVIAAVLIAILVTFLASIYPALKASQLDPAEGLRSE